MRTECTTFKEIKKKLKLRLPITPLHRETQKYTIDWNFVINGISYNVYLSNMLFQPARQNNKWCIASVGLKSAKHSSVWCVVFGNIVRKCRCSICRKTKKMLPLISNFHEKWYRKFSPTWNLVINSRALFTTLYIIQTMHTNHP